MEALAAKATAKSKKKSRKIPEALIYEVVGGKPVYYKGYRDVLSGKLNLESVMSESTLQAWLKARLSFLLVTKLENQGFDVLTGELGLLLGKGDHRGADLAIYKSEELVLDAHYSKIPPEIIIEIDIQAELKKADEMDYIATKIADYHRFGVKKVIWIFTSIKKVTVANAGEPWITYDWSKTIETVEGVSFNLEVMLKGKTAKQG